MARIDFRDKIEATMISDPARRKNVFREMGKDFLAAKREGAVTDGPGSIARMMEQAYKAGQAGTKPEAVSGPQPARTIVRFTEMDLPPTSRNNLRYLRLLLFRTGEITDIRTLPDVTRLFVFRKPEDASLTSGLWHVYWSQSRPALLPNKVFLPFLKEGLFEFVQGIMKDGWEAACVTERGYELLRTGKTSPQGEYHPGTTSTAQEWVKVQPPLERVDGLVFMSKPA